MSVRAQIEPDCERLLKIAIICTHAGADGTRASTALMGTLAEGFVSVGVSTCIVGLAQEQRAWNPGSLGPVETRAPWLEPPARQSADRVVAARLGILDAPACDERRHDGGTIDWYRELLLQTELQRFAGSEQDLVLLVYPRHFPILSTVVRIAKRCGWRVLVFATETLDEESMGPDSSSAYVQKVLTGSDGVLAVSDYLAKYWIGHGEATERVRVMPTPVRSAFFTDPTIAGTPGTAVYLGNLEHGVDDYLLDVADRVRDRVGGFRLWVYGDALDQRREAVRTKVTARGLGDVVEVRDPISPTASSAVMAKARVLLVPPRDHGRSATGGFPMKLSECLASGRPVVTTTMGDIPLYLVDRESAFMVRPDDGWAFADALAEALENPEVASRIGARGRRVAEERLAAAVVARAVLEFIEGLPTRRMDRASLAVLWTRHRLIASERERPDWPARVDRIAAQSRTSAEGAIRSVASGSARRLRYTRSGHTRVMAFKMAAVQVLRALRLKPPAPRD